ncbi:hypothetical protein V500_00702 [Pseudogymnoascus sp. VKM F-4518 (FW-2643)]|nr:hypothetical protein V500_00702 [Pseudogymnoascus sp. VKM F-4518 (FW-2643)]
MVKVIAVLGATGTQGGSVIRTFLKEDGWKVRALTRDPNKASSKALSVSGCEVVGCDIDDKQSLTRAFNDAHAIFAVTDFWGPVFNPSTAKERSLQTLEEKIDYAYKLEIERAKNIINAAAALADGVLEIFVWSSLTGGKAISNGKYSRMWHFETKDEAARYIFEQKPELAKKTSLIQLSGYAENIHSFPVFKPQKQADNSFVLTVPISIDAPVTFLVASKDTGGFVWALVTQLPPGNNIEAYSFEISYGELLRLWGRINGVEAKAKEVSLEEYEATYSYIGIEVGEVLRKTQEYGYTNGAIKPHDLGVDVPVTGVEDFIRGTDWTSVLLGE